MRIPTSSWRSLLCCCCQVERQIQTHTGGRSVRYTTVRAKLRSCNTGWQLKREKTLRCTRKQKQHGKQAKQPTHLHISCTHPRTWTRTHTRHTRARTHTRVHTRTCTHTQTHTQTHTHTATHYNIGTKTKSQLCREWRRTVPLRTQNPVTMATASSGVRRRIWPRRPVFITNDVGK